MKRILIIGAGMSATTLLRYILDNSEKENWEVTVADFNLELAQRKTAGYPRATAVKLDATDDKSRLYLVSKADLVVSLLPPDMHVLVAKDCVETATHLVTASYVAPKMKVLDEAAKKAGVILLNECGLDPGIDHMSAMEEIHKIQDAGGNLTAFYSHCGALVSPEAKNQWGYKFTWAPRNVIMAGSLSAEYLEDNRIKYVPYHRLFECTRKVELPNIGEFESYPNRNSLSYRKPYGLGNIPTIYRGTLRFPGYCELWNRLIYIGLTDDHYQFNHNGNTTWRDFMYGFVKFHPGKSDRENLAHFLDLKTSDTLVTQLMDLGLFEDTLIKKGNLTPARILQARLEEKWKLEDQDIDMIFMQHQFEYEKEGVKKLVTSSMAFKGEDSEHTAISITVGLPAAIATKFILNGSIKERGVVIPTTKEIYQPVLAELQHYGIQFSNEEKVIAE